MRTTPVLFTAVLCGVAAPAAPAAAAAVAAAQEVTARAGPRPMLPGTEEIALARSAAPPAVSDSATVWILTERGYEVAIRGTNGVECYVSRSWPQSLEPHCLDAEGAATIMRIEMTQVELAHRGLGTDLIEREINAGIASGRFRLPRRPAMSWMMSPRQRLISDEGRPAGRWQPHLMIYYPYLTAAELGLVGNPDPSHAMLVSPGQAMSNLTIVVRNFTDSTRVAVR